MAGKENVGPLSEAINKADISILRSVLKSMCESSEECYKEAAQRLLLSVAGHKRKADGSPEGDANKRPKTVISRFEECVTCKKVFDVTDNRDDSCGTHQDYLDIVDDFFVDDDEITYGNIDPYTDWRRDEWPEGFMWQCCETTLKDNKPCRVQKHIAAKSDGTESQETDDESPIEISSDED